MLRLQDVYYGFTKHQPVLSSISLSIKPGITAIIGPNGAGKSTLLKLLAGLYKPSSGQIWLPEPPLSRQIAYLPAFSVPVFDFPAAAIIAMGRFPYNQGGQATAEDRLIIEEECANLRLTALCHKSFWELSSGEQQMMLLAKTFVQRTPIMILDEPLEHLDLARQKLIVERIKQYGQTVVLTGHDLHVVKKLTDQVIMLKAGRVWTELDGQHALTDQMVDALFDL